MAQFEVEVVRHWNESGSVTVEAADADEAREIVRGMLFDDDDSIEWDGSNMSPEGDDIEGVRKID